MVNIAHQELASKLIIGERLPPETVVQAGSGLDTNLQDLATPNFRFKFFIFGGNVENEQQQELIEAAVQAIQNCFPDYIDYDLVVITYGQDITEMSVNLTSTRLNWSK